MNAANHPAIRGCQNGMSNHHSPMIMSTHRQLEVNNNEFNYASYVVLLVNVRFQFCDCELSVKHISTDRYFSLMFPLHICLPSPTSPRPQHHFISNISSSPTSPSSPTSSTPPTSPSSPTSPPSWGSGHNSPLYSPLYTSQPSIKLQETKLRRN